MVNGQSSMVHGREHVTRERVTRKHCHTLFPRPERGQRAGGGRQNILSTNRHEWKKGKKKELMSMNLEQEVRDEGE